MIILIGCSSLNEKDSENVEKNQENKNVDEVIMKQTKAEEREVEEIIRTCLESYEETDKLDDLEASRNFVDTLGENGYTAVDSENQINMTEHEKLIQFCKKVEAKENGRITIVEIVGKGNYIIRHMETTNGTVNIIRRHYIYEDGEIKLFSEDIYRAESWKYTEDGYLLFSGWLTFEDSYEVTRNEIMEYTAYRVQPLAENYRELNRKYILPIGYECNNMFLTD